MKIQYSTRFDYCTYDPFLRNTRTLEKKRHELKRVAGVGQWTRVDSHADVKRNLTSIGLASSRRFHPFT